MNQWRITSDNSLENSSRLGGYRSRYYAFLQQKSNKPSAQLQKLTQFGRGVMSIAIFIALFIVILTLFGIGLSWYNRINLPQNDGPAPNEQAISGASANLLPPPPALPAGQADARKKARK